MRGAGDPQGWVGRVAGEDAPDLNRTTERRIKDKDWSLNEVHITLTATKMSSELQMLLT